MIKKKIAVSVATIATALTVLCASGVTLAVNMTGNRSQGTLTTADLNLFATAKNVKVFSSVPTDKNAEGAFGNDDIGYFVYQDGVVQGANEINFSSHEGKVKYNEEQIAIDNFTPGDKVEFDIEVSSVSTISFQYRTEIYVDATQGQTLLNNIQFTADNLGLLRKDVSKSDTNGADRVAAVLTDFTEWKTVGSDKTRVETVHVTISLPIEVKQGQEETVNFYYVVSGIQNTVSQEDVARFETAGGGTVGFKTIKEAVAYAKANGIVDIPVVGSTVLEEGEVIIDDVVHFVGVADKENNYPVLRGVRFIVENGAAATFENVNFGGASYIDVSRATVLKLDNCRAVVEPVAYFDSVKHTFIEDNAFIVSSSTLTPVRLTLNNSTVISGGGAAIALSSPLSSESEISGNTFGSEPIPYGGSAVLKFGGASSDAVIYVRNNKLYGNRALSLGGTGSTPYLVVSEGNTAYGVKDGIFVGGSAGAAFVDKGSKIGESELKYSDIENGALAFGGVDVTLNNLNRITAGKLAVCEDNITMSTFFNRYVAGSTLETNAIELYKDGKLYAYLNASADAETDYELNVIG